MLDNKRRVNLSKDVLLRPVGQEGVLLNLKTGLYFSLDPVGMHILATLSDCPSIEDALVILQLKYEVEPAELRSDVLELIENLLKQGLVELA